MGLSTEMLGTLHTANQNRRRCVECAISPRMSALARCSLQARQQIMSTSTVHIGDLHQYMYVHTYIHERGGNTVHHL